MRSFTTFKIFLAVSIISIFSYPLQAQQSKWILGSSQANAAGTFYTLGTNNLKFYEINFNGSISSTQRVTGNSINNIQSVGTQDVMQSAVDASGNVSFYAFGATTVPFQSSGPSTPDTIYFAAYNATTLADEVFGKVATEGWGASVIESELVRRPGSTTDYYFIYKTKSGSTSLDNIRYVTINAATKSVSSPITIITNEKTGEGMAVSQENCINNQRWLFTSRPESSGDITIKKCAITNSGISTGSVAYTIVIPGNSISIITAIEIAPTNDKFVISNYSGSSVNKDVILLDFNNVTGSLSNERYYTTQSGYPIVTMEFSPDATRIYFLQGGSSAFPNVLYSSPVTSTNHTITLAEQLSGLTLDNSLTLETAFDGKLYINPSQNANFLYVIANPNSSTPTVSTTVTNLFGVGERIGAGFPDQVDGEMSFYPCSGASTPEENNAAFLLHAYPNPSLSSFSVEFKLSTINEIDFQLYNTSGRFVRTERRNLSGNTLTIAREDLAPGIYFFKCYDKEQIIGIGKVIIN
ncbi:MAG TPA: T9SS type A sorting domain-containing protein [Bacteroidia bacterium]|jgi:hypothetical protein